MKTAASLYSKRDMVLIIWVVHQHRFNLLAKSLWVAGSNHMATKTCSNSKAFSVLSIAMVTKNDESLTDYERFIAFE